MPVARAVLDLVAGQLADSGRIFCDLDGGEAY
jgi:hypothetical protein